MKYKVCVIGDQGALLPYRIAGVPTFQPKSIDHLERLISNVIHQDYGVIFILENYLHDAQHILAEYDNELVPALIPIPSSGQSKGIGKTRQVEMMERAVGMNFMREEDED